MFYAKKEFPAYTRNSGTQSFPAEVRIYGFTSRRLRDIWLQQNEGEIVRARDPLVRKHNEHLGTTMHDGDYEVWTALAKERVRSDPQLSQFAAFILDGEWSEVDHPRWVARAPKREVLSWARDLSE